MNRIQGLHHLAIATGNMKAQIEFCTDVLGMELVALYWMHGVPDTWHGFLRLNDESCIAFVQNPGIAAIPREIGRTHAGNSGGNCAPGTMQHVALRVRDHDELLAMRDRLRAKGVPVLGPLDHGMCQSIYFAGPENLCLELSYSTEPVNAEAWIDPEVVALAGISAEELVRYKRPAAFEDGRGAVPQPGPDAPGPHMTGYPPGLYERLLRLSDQDITRGIENRPPVQVD
ncbi:MAG: VOC family protein [Pseudomonadales bacterium]|nr:VOC family protein [Pseudomonadales bacterium]